MSERKFSVNDMMDSVYDVFDENLSFCKYDVGYEIQSDRSGSVTLSDSMHPPGSIPESIVRVIIGFKPMLDNVTPDGYVMDKSMVRAVFEAFHESGHLWEISVGLMQPRNTAPRIIKDMSRERAIGICFPEYARMSYVLDISEILANKYAVVNTKRFFMNKGLSDSRFLDVDVEGFLQEFSGEIYDRSWSGTISHVDFDSLVKSYDDMLLLSLHRNRMNISWLDRQDHKCVNLRKLLADKNTMSAVLSASDGIEETDVLCHYVGKHHPECFRGLPSIRDDYVSLSAKSVTESVLRPIMRIRELPWHDMPGISFDEDYGF